MTNYTRALLFGAILWGTTSIVFATPPTLQILSPRENPASLSKDSVNIMGKATGVKEVTINDQKVEVFATTQVFAIDKLPLKEGENSFVITAKNADGVSSETLQVNYAKHTLSAPPKQITGIAEDTISPKGTRAFWPGETMKISFQGMPGMKAQYLLPGQDWKDMIEVPSEAEKSVKSFYEAATVLLTTPDAAPIEFKASSEQTSQTFTAKSEGVISVMNPNELKMIRVISDLEYLSYGLHEVRLGGPYMAALPKGTLLRVIGQVNDMYHVRLSPTQEAWISASEKSVEVANGEVPPHGFFTSLTAKGNETSDSLSIPWNHQPYSVVDRVAPNGNAELVIDVYGAHDATTWASHKSSRQVIKRAWTEQMDPEWLRIHAELNTPIMWGYSAEVSGNSLIVYTRKAPKINRKAPLRGRTIAIEAGHGGQKNIGARGVSGSEEQMVNWETAQALEKELKAKGANVIQVRVGSENPNFSERIGRARAGKADLFIAIHANSAGSSGGFYSASGLSDYYKYQFSAPLAQAIHEAIISTTHFEDWGVVGNFNYSAIRISSDMPGMLVEQAFMSNPKDEAMLLDPAVRKKIANGIALGIEDYLRSIAELQK
ncbi:N-acetylmuramoyl-L-alanine amidase [Candidatus Sumerlaeota bacterium]|nr:N-acetylmuramoyl-L-alanine amidase [Candidatus Sumerlaeota bacterium]